MRRLQYREWRVKHRRVKSLGAKYVSSTICEILPAAASWLQPLISRRSLHRCSMQAPKTQNRPMQRTLTKTENSPRSPRRVCYYNLLSKRSKLSTIRSITVESSRVIARLKNYVVCGQVAVFEQSETVFVHRGAVVKRKSSSARSMY